MRWPGAWGKLLLLGLIPTLFLEGVRQVADAPFAWPGLVARWGFVIGILVAALLTPPHSVGGGRYTWPGLLWGVPTAVAGAIYGLTGATWAAWPVVGTTYVLLLGLETVLAGGRSHIRRWTWRVLLAVVAGLFPVALSQLESRFADEEFFVALEAVALSVFWLLLLGGYRWLGMSWPFLGVRGVGRQSSGQGIFPRPEGSGHSPVLMPKIGRRRPTNDRRLLAGDLSRHLQVNRRIVGLVFCLAAFAGLNGTVWAYRHSFYPPAAPTYPGISAQTPFLCGQVPPDPETYDGLDVFHRILTRVEANPRKESPEYGMLALGTGERRWAEAFREALRREVAEGRYTGPAHSVKSVQFKAALRAYYYPRVRDRFPGLFSDAEEGAIRAWFAAINRRALTVEWVDLMYALAFSKWPEGPYENQENGAGLLALLEAEGLADPVLSAANRDYLARNRRGWTARFRVTDDALVYHPEWIDNAYFQSLYTGEALDPNARLSFEWLLLQALPDGAPLGYNHPGRSSPVGIAYLGAKLFGDPRYIWLAGRAVEALERQGGYLFAQPGVEEPVPLEGRAPTEGSCLLYGDSGLPNRKGPLAPDKIIFRDGWGEEATYLLVNLRFSGWHRYKATGTVTLVYQGGSLVADVLEGKPFEWLPVGRSLFRDKRIPRENLNGLVVPKTGMAAVLYALTGVGGPWAQDPPYYAEVVAFETGEEMDWAHIRLTNWRGWEQDRWVYFYRNGGPIVVVDEARGPVGAEAALVWHPVQGEAVGENRFRLRADGTPAEMVMIPLSNGSHTGIPDHTSSTSEPEVTHYRATKLSIATIFLRGTWVGAEIEKGTARVEIRKADMVVSLTIPK